MMQRKERDMDERDLTMNERDLAWCEREDLQDAYHRSWIEMAQAQRRARETGKLSLWFLEDDEDWTPVPMDATFWVMVVGGLTSLRRYLSHTGVLRPET